MLHRKDEILKPFDLDKCPGTNLPDELKRFMEKIVRALATFPILVDGFEYLLKFSTLHIGCSRFLVWVFAAIFSLLTFHLSIQ